MRLVNFIGIGAAKSATTWIADCLKSHRDIIMPKRYLQNNKELNFFNRSFARGYSYYHSLFPNFDANKIKGEYSVLYMPEENVARRIHEYNPNIKLLVSLRNPIDRAFSHHKMHVAGGTYKADLYSFEKALEQNPSYLELGMYGQQLQAYLKYFGKSQIHIVLFKDIKENPRDELIKIYKFLGVELIFNENLFNKKSNKSVSLRNKPWIQTILKINDLQKKIFGRRLNNLFEKTGLSARIKSKAERDPTDYIPPLKAETREKMREIFIPEIKILENEFNLDLSHWK